MECIYMSIATYQLNANKNDAMTVIAKVITGRIRHEDESDDRAYSGKNWSDSIRKIPVFTCGNCYMQSPVTAPEVRLYGQCPDCEQPIKVVFAD